MKLRTALSIFTAALVLTAVGPSDAQQTTGVPGLARRHDDDQR